MSLLQTANRIYGQSRGYGRLTIARQVDATLTRPPAEVRSRQLADFRHHVRRCLERFPFYRDKVEQALGRLPDVSSEFLPTDLPIWTKQDQRDLFATLDPREFQGCFRHATGGSTGVPTQFYMTRESSEWRQAVTDRGYGYAGAEPGRRALYIWSDPATPSPLLKRLKMSLHQRLLNHTHFNCFFFNDERKRLCCEAINRRRPETIVSYASKVAELAVFVRDNPGLLRWRTKNILTGAEGLREGQRELIREHLGDQVFMSYGSREFMLIGMESRHQCGYHLSDDNLLVEVIDEDGRPTPAGESGRICVTDLHNATNPFIRYEIGDLGIMADDDEPCPDGFPFRRLLRVQGRAGEFVYTPDGARLTAIYFAHNLKELSWIDGYQLVQDSKERLHIRVVTAGPLTDAMKAEADAQLRQKLGDMRLEFERVTALETAKNGKTPVVILNMKEETPAS
jgi:phenylacetate-CoA ligase